jgi:CheY-like chemotaxis protein
MKNKGYSFLIVEDEELNRFVIDKILKPTEHAYTFAGTGEEAVMLVQKQHFDIILLDIELPGMGGYETANEISKIIRNPTSSPVILAMTGHQHPEDPKQVAEAGMHGWVVKPFRLEDLEDAIKKAQSLSSTAQQSNTPIVNLNVLYTIAGDDPGFIRLCIELFLKEMPENLNRLNTAIDQTDWEGIRTTSHKMKTSLNYMGLNEQRLAALNIEKLARDKRDLERIKSDANSIMDICSRAFEELKLKLNKQEAA